MSTQALTKNNFLPSTFDEFFRPWNTWFDGFELRPNWASASLPAVNVVESKDDYKISLAAPGMEKEDFKVVVEGGNLTISAEKEDEKEVSKARFTRREYNYSSFTRSFALPTGVNREHITASYEKGILQLTLPKKEEARRNGGPVHVPVS